MDKLIDLSDLLKHEIMDLYSAEEQIIEALPAMIAKAKNPSLTKLLSDHLKTTEGQLERLKAIQHLLGTGDEAGEVTGETKGFFSRLFSKFGSGGQKCRGMEGILIEGEKVLSEDMSEEVKDAAIIAAAQKVEHYEICGYGTARAYARELKLGEIAELLEETLKEEYAADDLLTDLAVGKLNEEAITADDNKDEEALKSNSEPGSNGYDYQNKARATEDSSGIYDVSRKAKPARGGTSKQTPGRGIGKSSKSGKNVSSGKSSQPSSSSSNGSAGKSTSKSSPGSKQATASKSSSKASAGSAKGLGKPASKGITKPKSKTISKPQSKASAKPASKGYAKPVSKGSAKSTSKYSSKFASKSVSKAPAKPVAKSPVKPVSKSFAKPVSRGASSAKAGGKSSFGSASSAKAGKKVSGNTAKGKSGVVSKPSASRGGSKAGARKGKGPGKSVSKGLRRR